MSSSWRAQDLGRNLLLDYFLESFPSVIVNDMQRIEAALTPAQRASVGFTLASFDPKRDTPEALAEYRKVRNLAAEHWTLLRGEPDDVQELAALLGVRY